MKRGELWTMAGGTGYTSKPRPNVIVQDDAYTARDSIVVCLITTDATDLPVFRVPVDPTAENGLRATSRLMVDKVTTVTKSRLGQRIGRLGACCA
jgi:mRNA interferase MazF